MEKGWNAKGLLKPLWSRLEGKRDELARMTGIGGGVLSAYNSGKRPLGIANARRIAAALGVTVEELGGPAEPGVELALADRLRALEAAQIAAEVERTRVAEHLAGLEARVAGLEAALASSRSGAGS